ncbi:hypothetical protein ACFQ3W_23280 [Paenibacillus puldeungensis]|uniref:Uncharacterized protein n=1 Tax=Paenibacillus puldeungensis TaxID=696536 RepID=A0ABW3S5G0_9BACL
MAKTDWTLTDTVKPTDLNGIGQEINQNKETVDTHLLDNSKQVPHLGTTSNVGDAYSITTTETINANQKFTIKFNSASTTSPTLKINAGVACSIKKANGNAAKLYASVYTLFWDGTNFILLGEGGETGTATAGDVRAGKTIGGDTLVTGTLPVQATTAQTITPGTTNIVKAAGIYDGPITVLGDADLVPGNIPNDTNLFGIQGALERLTTTDKQSIATQITNKGVAASVSDAPSMLAAKIGQIAVGKSFISANLGTPSSLSIQYDCGFVPAIIFVLSTAPNGTTSGATLAKSSLWGGTEYKFVGSGQTVWPESVSGNVVTLTVTNYNGWPTNVRIFAWGE